MGLGDFIEECFFICFPLQCQSSLQLSVCVCVRALMFLLSPVDAAISRIDS